MILEEQEIPVPRLKAAIRKATLEINKRPRRSEAIEEAQGV